MKVRTDFVTNSSSSSFLTIKFESNTLAEIISRFQDEAENKKEYCPCTCFDVKKDYVEYNEEESAYWEDSITTLKDALNILMSLFYDWNETPLQISDDEVENERVDLTQYMGDDAPLRHKIGKEIFKKRNAILEDTQFAEVITGSVGWGGDDDTRYYEESYDADTLQSIRESIAEVNNISVDDITNDDFCEYVSDCMSVSEDTYTFKRTADGKIKEDTKYRYYLEG